MSQIRVDTDLRERRAIKAKRLTLQIFSATTWMVLTSVMLVACQQPAAQPSRQDSESTLLAHPAPVKSQATISTGSQAPASLSYKSKFRKGMAYADLRESVIDSGWKPVIDPECKSNVIGANYAQLCSAHPELDECHACVDLPELGSCSGDGYCGMTFNQEGKTLDITTYGMIEDRATKGNRSRLQVMEWKFGGNQSSP